MKKYLLITILLSSAFISMACENRNKITLVKNHKIKNIVSKCGDINKRYVNSFENKDGSFYFLYKKLENEKLEVRYKWNNKGDRLADVASAYSGTRWKVTFSDLPRKGTPIITYTCSYTLTNKMKQDIKEAASKFYKLSLRKVLSQFKKAKKAWINTLSGKFASVNYSLETEKKALKKAERALSRVEDVVNRVKILKRVLPKVTIAKSELSKVSAAVDALLTKVKVGEAKNALEKLTIVKNTLDEVKNALKKVNENNRVKKLVIKATNDAINNLEISQSSIKSALHAQNALVFALRNYHQNNFKFISLKEYVNAIKMTILLDESKSLWNQLTNILKVKSAVSDSHRKILALAGLKLQNESIIKNENFTNYDVLKALLDKTKFINEHTIVQLNILAEAYNRNGDELYVPKSFNDIVSRNTRAITVVGKFKEAVNGLECANDDTCENFKDAVNGSRDDIKLLKDNSILIKYNSSKLSQKAKFLHHYLLFLRAWYRFDLADKYTSENIDAVANNLHLKESYKENDNSVLRGYKNKRRWFDFTTGVLYLANVDDYIVPMIFSICPFNGCLSNNHESFSLIGDLPKTISIDLGFGFSILDTPHKSHKINPGKSFITGLSWNPINLIRLSFGLYSFENSNTKEFNFTGYIGVTLNLKKALEVLLKLGVESGKLPSPEPLNSK